MGRHGDDDGDGPTLGGTWQERMAVRGGRVSHALATSGWTVLGGLGAVVGALVMLLYVMTGHEYGTAAGRVVGGLILFVPGGFVLFALVFGLPAQLAARSWLRSPSRAEVDAARADAPPDVPDGLREGSTWAELFASCSRSVTAFHAVVRTLDDGPAREWFTGIGETLDRELDEALRLARLGESLEAAGRGGEPGGPPGSEAGPDTGSATGPGTGSAAGRGTVDEVAERLRGARTAFAETTDRAGRTALELGPGSDLSHVRAQLDVLATQVPVLRSDP